MIWYNLRTKTGSDLDPSAIWEILLQEDLSIAKLKKLRKQIEAYYYADFYKPRNMRLFVLPYEVEEVLKEIDNMIIMKGRTWPS